MLTLLISCLLPTEKVWTVNNSREWCLDSRRLQLRYDQSLRTTEGWTMCHGFYLMLLKQHFTWTWLTTQDEFVALETHTSETTHWFILSCESPYRDFDRKYIRSLKNFGRDKFAGDLSAVPFHILEIFDDGDYMYVFEALYNDILYEHSPLHFNSNLKDISGLLGPLNWD